MNERTYIAIDLKSFYASVECVERGLNPMTTNLVVADASRTSKTICLAVSPALKAHGIPGRCRLFELEQAVARLNATRPRTAPEITYIVAPPRMALYMQYSTRVFSVYLKYVAPEDIHVYSIDEVFIDVTGYLNTYRLTAHELTLRMVRDVLATTGITATAGIGQNLYLAKVAMDIVAKHMPPDADGVRIAELDEAAYRRTLWAHEPITDFWRVGRGTARRLARLGLRTMGDVALLSTTDEELLYKAFGINAELLIDHAWGYESCTMADIKAYKPTSSSLSSGQVLTRPYTFAEARVVVREMADALALDLTAKGLAAEGITLMVGYEHVKDAAACGGDVVRDYYGRLVPKPAVGSVRFARPTASGKQIVAAALAVFDRQVAPALEVRRINVAAVQVVPARGGVVRGNGAGRGKGGEGAAVGKCGEGASAGKCGEDAQCSVAFASKTAGQQRGDACVITGDVPARVPTRAVQLDLFGEIEVAEAQEALSQMRLAREQALREAMVDVKVKYGKNALLKGTNFVEGATGRARNEQIGGHRA